MDDLRVYSRNHYITTTHLRRVRRNDGCYMTPTRRPMLWMAKRTPRICMCGFRQTNNAADMLTGYNSW